MKAPAVTQRSCWGDKRGSQVFSEVILRGQRIIFRFSTDPTFRRSFQSRIVTCYHGNPAADETETFVDIPTFCKALGWSIDQVWNRCSCHPSIINPDVVVEIYEDERSRLQWRLSHLSIYEDFLKQLLPLSEALYEELPLDSYETFRTVDISTLGYGGTFQGLSHNKLVRLHPDVRLESDPEFFVFKGLDLAKYLITGSEFRYWRDRCYREIRTIRSLRPHPNIASPVRIFVTVAEISDKPNQAFVSGTLQPYMKNGNLNDRVKRIKMFKDRLELGEKVRWCYQMVDAIAHTHFESVTYHQDIKPSNFLINDNRDLILIGWEQSGATRCTIAPEANGSYDVEVQAGSPNAKPLYKIYDGPARVNHPSSWPHWNVFPIWSVTCPEALEAAEVFSLGRTMWMLLEEVDEGSLAADVGITYWQKAYDVPEEYKAVIDHCLESDPNKRIGLLELENVMAIVSYVFRSIIPLFIMFWGPETFPVS